MASTIAHGSLAGLTESCEIVHTIVLHENGFTQWLKTKMVNYRTQQKSVGCSELLAHSLKSNVPEDALPAKKKNSKEASEKRGQPHTWRSNWRDLRQIGKWETVTFKWSAEAKQSCSDKRQNGWDPFTVKTVNCEKGIRSGRVEREMACLVHSGWSKKAFCYQGQ